MVDNGKPSFLAVYMILSARKLMPSVLLRFGMETIRSWMLRTDWEYPQPWNQPVVYATSIKNHQKTSPNSILLIRNPGISVKIAWYLPIGHCFHYPSLEKCTMPDWPTGYIIHHHSSTTPPIFLMITVIPVNMLNLTWMMIESPVQITIHNPQKR